MAPLPAKRERRKLIAVAGGAAVLFGLSSPAAWVSPRGSPDTVVNEVVQQRGSNNFDRAEPLQPLVEVESQKSGEAGSFLPSLAAAGACLAVLAGMFFAAPDADAAIGGEGWEIRNVMPVKPPVPDENPFIRQLQAKSWKMQPFQRQRNFLKAMKSRMTIMNEIGFFSPKYFVHWAEDSYKYDILEEKNFTEANKLGKLLVDSNMSEPAEELPVFVYAKPEDQNWVAENLGVYDLVEIPDELVKAIEEVRATPFPKYEKPDPRLAPPKFMPAL